jgi:hydrogenase maturation protein HypF
VFGRWSRTKLEGLSRDADAGTACYAFHVDGGAQPTVIDPAPVLSAIIRDVRNDVPAGVIGARFHRAVADLIVDVATSEDPAPRAVALSGGVFQNVMLLRLTRNSLVARGFEVLTHRHVPPNDGGIALGQLLVGNAG